MLRLHLWIADSLVWICVHLLAPLCCSSLFQLFFPICYFSSSSLYCDAATVVGGGRFQQECSARFCGPIENRFLWPCCKLRHIDTSAWSRTRFVWVCESRGRERNCQFLICPRSFSVAKMSITQGMYREVYKPYRSSLYERREREKVRRSDYFSLLMAVWLDVLDWLSIKFFLHHCGFLAVFAILIGGYHPLGELRIVCSLHYWHIVWALFVQDLSSTCPERSNVLKLKHCREI